MNKKTAPKAMKKSSGMSKKKLVHRAIVPSMKATGANMKKMAKVEVPEDR